MLKGSEITHGKTKALYEAPGRPDVVVMKSFDSITAGDGARRDVIEGKGRMAAQTTSRVFRLLNLCGFPTHYISGGEDDDDNEILVRRCKMIPLEVVVRGVAAGSFVRRRGMQRGSLLVPRVIEFFLKDDANHDPLIEPDQIVAQGIALPQEVPMMGEVARMVYEVLSHAWRRRDVLLIDLKVEFGRLLGGENEGSIVLADVIDNDAWRIWPQGREDMMLDKQIYRNLETVTPEGLARVREAYEQVTNMVGEFPQMRPGMVALIAEDQSLVERVNEIARGVQAFGLPSTRHIASSSVTPGFVAQMVQQLDATFARLVHVPVGPPGLAAMIENLTTNPVLDPGTQPPHLVAQATAKALGLDDTVLFGRVLLTQANARSAVLQADANLNNVQNLPPGTAIA